MYLILQVFIQKSTFLCEFFDFFIFFTYNKEDTRMSKQIVTEGKEFVNKKNQILPQSEALAKETPELMKEIASEKLVPDSHKSAAQLFELGKK